MSTLHVITCGGLGNRLIPITSAMRLVGQGYFDELLITWDHGYHCEADWSDLFDVPMTSAPIKSETPYQQFGYAAIVIPGKDVVLSEYRLVAVPNDLRRPGWAESFKKWGIPKDMIAEIRPYAAKMTPTPTIQQAVDAVKFPDDTTGIHVRRTDAIYGNYDLKNKKLLSLLDRKIKSEPLFVSSDDPFVEKLVRDEFPDQVISIPKRHYGPNVLSPKSPRSCESMIEGLIDMLVLAKTSRIIRDLFSTFSTAATLFGRAYIDG